MKSFPGRTQFKNADCGIIFNTYAHMVLTSTFELKIIHRKKPRSSLYQIIWLNFYSTNNTNKWKVTLCMLFKDIIFFSKCYWGSFPKGGDGEGTAELRGLLVSDNAYQILSRVLINFYSVKNNNMKPRKIKWRMGHQKERSTMEVEVYFSDQLHVHLIDNLSSSCLKKITKKVISFIILFFF